MGLSEQLSIYERIRDLTLYYFSLPYLYSVTICDLKLNRPCYFFLSSRSEILTLFTLSNTEIMVSNPTRGMDANVRLFCLCCPVCG
jgi:hypothetical protein